MINPKRFQEELLAWYRDSQRPLPWRKTRDPYAIWISEILLQQTRVNAAIAYYERFLGRFPTLAHLAEARIESVLQVWQGLGYYGRARNLHRAARILRHTFGGQIPRKPESLAKLPGIGPYTANAIASIAFDEDVAVLDGNVIRVLCRVYGIRDIPDRPSTRRRLERIAESLLPKGHAAAFNQAMMELGALVCRPDRPDCASCPVRGLCRACREGTAGLLPVRIPKPRIPVRVKIVGAIEHRGRLLFARRPLEGFLGGLWELPGAYLEGEETARQGIEKLRRQVGSRLRQVPEEEAFTVRQAYSHFEERNLVFMCEGMGGVNRGSEQRYRWLHPTSLHPYPITGATRKIVRRLEQRETKQAQNARRGRKCPIL
jgi:A/G-specific adenine glycosylase